MRIAIATDAWHPQINGVVTTLSHTAAQLEGWGHRLLTITPEGFRALPCPTYPEIPLALGAGGEVARRLDAFAPEAVHIATEGPLGLAARRWCLRRRRPFTTSYHTRFPEYLRLRAPVPLALSYAAVRWFHRPAVRTLVTTLTMKGELERWGFERLELWGRGVDTGLFRPRPELPPLEPGPDPAPVFLYVGRVAVEKNIEAFLALDLPGVKYVVGDGPARTELQARHPEVRFTGMKQGEELARLMAAAKVFVFPSRTDTFGIVMLEALASGVPVAAYPVAGPRDVIVDGDTGALDEDLRRAALRALALDGGRARAFALTRSWEAAVRQFLSHLHFEPAAA